MESSISESQAIFQGTTQVPTTLQQAWLPVLHANTSVLKYLTEALQSKLCIGWYDGAIVDMRRCREEKQNLEHMVERLRRELDRTRNARDMAQAQLEKRQRELVGALDTMRVSEERRIEEAMRMDARAREVEKRADASRRVEDEATRRTIEERLVKEARRKGRREGRRERRRRKSYKGGNACLLKAMGAVIAENVSINLTYQGTPHTFTFPSESTITDLSNEVASSLLIPPSNQKFMISKLGLLKTPFKDPTLPLSSIRDKKINLLGSTAAVSSSISESASAAARYVNPRRAVQKVTAYKTHDWKKEQEEAQYTFQTLRPLPYLPNPDRSLQFLERLKNDTGIKTAMRKHKFSVSLLTEMNPVEYTESNHEGTTRILGLNRNQGEVIELRLRTDAYDGYRDYKTIRKTLCHELAHNVHGPHDRKFWDLCKEIEREVEGVEGGRRVGEEEFYEGEMHDEGGWTGGEFVLGVGKGEGQQQGQGVSRREILARAAEERMKRIREQGGGSGSS
ncbi:hypothetical protein B7494_g839 [Chlorociboria aeruginascens]|nr:hypothetical protein B7494_g839 [Chlorociboria aeruginascens]